MPTRTIARIHRERGSAVEQKRAVATGRGTRVESKRYYAPDDITLSSTSSVRGERNVIAALLPSGAS